MIRTHGRAARLCLRVGTPIEQNSSGLDQRKEDCISIPRSAGILRARGEGLEIRTPCKALIIDVIEAP